MKNRRTLSLLLTVMILLSSLPFAGVTAFASVSGDYEYNRTQENTIEILGYYGSATSITIPSQINGYPVTRIGSIAFSGCSSLKSVVIPNSVTSIGYAAFSDCTNLKSVTLPNKLKQIDTKVFANCEKLSSIQIPDSVNYIGSSAFESCTSLNNLIIGNNVTTIGKYAFYNCSNLNNITLGNNLKRIGDRAFSNTAYYNDNSNWENGVLYLCDYLIDASNNLSGSYTVKNGTIGLAEYAFDYCYDLTGITIPNGTFYIGANAFSSCLDLKNITLPDSISYIGERAFSDTAYYSKKTNWENGVLYIGKHLIAVNRNNIAASYTVKDGTITIANESFIGCKNLIYVTIPNSVKYINDSAFYNCDNLINLTIGTGVKEIGAWIFCESENFCNIYYGGSKTQWNKILIDDNNEELFNATIHYNYDPNATLATPKIQSVSNTVLGVQIIWNEVKGAAYYKVFRKTGNGNWASLGITDSNAVIDISAESGKKYTYTVRCVASDGERYQSAYDTAGKSITYIAAPKLSEVSNTATGVKIAWGKVNGAEKYRVFYKTADSGWTKIADTTSTSYTWNGAKSGTKYTFTVRCINSSATAFTSAYDTTGKSITHLSAPKISSVTNTTTGVKISWGKVTGAAQYRVFYKANGESTWHKAGDTTSTNFTWTKAKSGTKYTFAVRCLSKDGNSYTSAYDTTGKSITYIAAPKLSSVANAATGVEIKWGKVTGAAQYRVFYKANGESTWHKAGDTTSTSFIWTKAVSGTKYTFTVRCIDKNGENYTSDYDTTGKSITYIAAPKITSLSKTSSGIQIKWDKVTGAAQYRVFYKANGESTWHNAGDTTSTSLTWTKAQSGTKYTFTVRCISADGKTYTSAYDATGKSITY